MLQREIGPLEEIPDRRSARAGDRVSLCRWRRAAWDSSRRSASPFCLNCNRLRLTSDGKLRYCLFAIEETDVRTLLRTAASEEAMEAAIRASVSAKWLGHEINSARFVPPPRPMYSIGG